MNVVNNVVIDSKNLETLLKETHEVLVENFEQELKEGKRSEFKVVDLWKLNKGSRSAHLNQRMLN